MFKLNFFTCVFSLFLITFSKAYADTSSLVFVSDRDGESGIYSVSSDGSDIKKINPSSDEFQAKQPSLPYLLNVKRPSDIVTYENPVSISPDGQWVVVDQKIRRILPGVTLSNLLLLNLTDNNYQILKTEDHGHISNATWSPDSQWVAAENISPHPTSYLSGSNKIYLVNVESGDIQILFEENGFRVDYPLWSPNAEKVSFICSNGDSQGICLVDIKTREWEKFSLPLRAGSRSWSPDGEKIVFSSSYLISGRIQYLISFLDLRTKETILLTDDGSNPRWSPDGEKIAFVRTLDGNQEIFVMDIDGQNITQLTDGSNPKWSPDGEKIAFVRTLDGNQEIFVMQKDGSGVTNISNHPADDLAPSWIPYEL